MKEKDTSRKEAWDLFTRFVQEHPWVPYISIYIYMNAEYSILKADDNKKLLYEK